MKKKIISVFLTVAMVSTFMIGCGKTDNKTPDTKEPTVTTEASTDLKDVKITLLNTKVEIQPQFEEMAKAYEAETGVKIEVYAPTGDSPSEEIAKKYAAGDAPTLIMGDPQDVLMIAAEKAVDLSNEDWATNGGTKYGISLNGSLYSFPFCIEARGLIYNKTAIEKTTGETFDPAAITNMDDLKVLLDKLVAGGMETPTALNKEDWSLAAHYLSEVYEEQDGTVATTDKFITDLKAGTVDLASNARFNAVMDTFDLLKEYNINKSDPMAADYDLNATYIAEGDVAFWFNGNWAWGNMKEYVAEGTELGILPVVQNDTTGNADINSYLCGSATKQVMIDKANSSPEQQQAAKDFLKWLVNSTEGQSFLVNDCSLIPAISTITESAQDPLGISVQAYSNAGKLFDGYVGYPGDHWKEMGATMQKYLANQIDRNELAEEITTYWSNIK